MHFKKQLFLVVLLITTLTSLSQTKPYVSNVWCPDNGNGTYKNPVINADYSDPDAIRVGEDYFLISSSFEHVPGLPILHSKDLVNWTIIDHVLKQQPPVDHFSAPRHGEGVWAPSIRYRNKEFYVYYPDPDFGIYVTKSKNIHGPWSEPLLVQAGRGLIDPCPLWDDDGNVYLVHAFAGSRAGFKSVLVVKKLNSSGTQVIDDGVLVYDGHELDPTIEGPKFYKRNGFYYIFAPAGGVSTGWQLVLRSKNIYGPYERRVVMDQGHGTVNGPHQGAWVQTQTGEDWFLHFQDKDAYGRVVHLQPMRWVNDWPVIGVDKQGNGKGEPVMVYRKPNVRKRVFVTNPQESDEFNSSRLGLQWQWQANPKWGWALPYPAKGVMRMNAQLFVDSMKNYWDVPSMLLQKFPADSFQATVKFNFKSKLNEDKFALVVAGSDYAYISCKRVGDELKLTFANCKNADKGNKESEAILQTLPLGELFFRVIVHKGAVCEFSCSTDGTSYQKCGEPFVAKPGRWAGAKVGFFCSRKSITTDAAYCDIDSFHIEKL